MEDQLKVIVMEAPTPDRQITFYRAKFPDEPEPLVMAEVTNRYLYTTGEANELFKKLKSEGWKVIRTGKGVPKK